MALFSCPNLNGKVDLIKERERHIAENHPDLLPDNRRYIAITLSDPDQVRHSSRFENALLFSRWFKELHDGKYIIVVVVTDSGSKKRRNWIITAYMARKLAGGELEWKRS